MTLLPLLGAAACATAVVVFTRRALDAERELHRLRDFPVDVTPTLRFASRALTLASVSGVVAARLALGPAGRWFVLLAVFVALRVGLAVLVKHRSTRG
ncbi:MAG: hypothetical protein JNJ54_32360 [Myxococcaceae bacterium]|nr:hypothetical protein [Myxococcaceae bacterium]